MKASTRPIRTGTESRARKHTRDLPPVIVLNLFHSGLGIVRQLAGTGVRVVGLSADPRVYGNFSRLCEVRFAPNSQDQPQQLADFLLQSASDLHGAVIFPTRDADILFLDTFRSQLSSLYTLAIPCNRVLFGILDKAAMAETAANAGLPVPRTARVTDGSQLKLAAEAVGFPCVIKPISSTDWRQGSNWQAIGRRKAFRVHDMHQLKPEYERISRVRRDLLLQEWIPGAIDRMIVWGGYIGRNGQPVAYFTARKVVQSPEEFGTGCVVENVALPQLLAPSIELCRALGYSGIAEIEYKRDPRDGRIKLIELNPRHWDWHQLGAASSANITWAAYCDLTGSFESSAAPLANSAVRITRKTKWVAEDTFLREVLARLYEGSICTAKIWQQVAGRRMYSIFSWRDPMPLVRYSMRELCPSLIASAIRKLRRHLTGSTHRHNSPVLVSKH